MVFTLKRHNIDVNQTILHTKTQSTYPMARKVPCFPRTRLVPELKLDPPGVRGRSGPGAENAPRRWGASASTFDKPRGTSTLRGTEPNRDPHGSTIRGLLHYYVCMPVLVHQTLTNQGWFAISEFPANPYIMLRGFQARNIMFKHIETTLRQF